jgi:phosphoglycolate phosphatase-like HAD superfamily hydrolase
MTVMAEEKLLFLDFDGVICDSINETVLCSWLAYYKYLKKSEPPECVPGNHKKQFLVYRPYIRSAADYIVIQDLLVHRLQMDSQEDFDEVLKALGQEVLTYYQEIFYRARTEIFTAWKSIWLGLNPLYPHMDEIMAKAARSSRVYILSTKKPEFINEILKGHSLDFDAKRIIYPGQEEKLAIIARILDQEKAGKAYFVDDQISHLHTNTDPRIKTFLASWGYIEEKWLSQERVEVLTLPGLLKLLGRERF